MAAFLIAEVEAERLALPAAEVEQVLRMAALSPLHGAPPSVEGVLDLHGELVPVVDVRARLGLPARPARPEHHLIVVRRPRGRIALHVDRVAELVEGADEAVEPAGSWSAGAELVAGAVKLPSGPVVVQRVEALVRPAERGAGAAPP